MPEPLRRDTGNSVGGTTSRTAPKLEQLLASAAGLMARRGFSQTSIRDVANETGFSLGGLYYYFENKEDLLFLIQETTFGKLLEIQEAAVAEGGTAEERLRRLVQNHLAYFTSHFNELKVCTFELESLQGDRYAVIADLRRRYYRCLAGVVGELAGEPSNAGRVRRQTLYVFGMLNWVFMWFDADRDKPIAKLVDEMAGLVLHGLATGEGGRP